ncbi:MAG: hypothetical protein ACRDQ7_00940 [Haloechinothrix sp.]
MRVLPAAAGAAAEGWHARAGVVALIACDRELLAHIARVNAGMGRAAVRALSNLELDSGAGDRTRVINAQP